MSSPALLAIAFTISLLCAAGMGYVLLRSRSSQQRIRRGLESAVRESEQAPRHRELFCEERCIGCG